MTVRYFSQNRRTCLKTVLFAGTGVVSAVTPATVAWANFSEQSWHFVVGYALGGASDKVARIVAEKLQKKWGVSVVVENTTGAGGRLAAQQVRRAPSTQNVLMLANPAVMVVAPLVFEDNGYDANIDFVPVSHVNSYDFVLVVNASSPHHNINQLSEWLRQNAAQATVGVPATGSMPHFFALMLGEKLGIQPQIVGYSGSAPLANDLLGGQITMAFDTLDAVQSMHEAGKVRILAVSSEKRAAFAADIPTFREAGLGVVASGWNTFFAPVSMSAGKIERVSQAIHEIMQDPDTVKEFMDSKLMPVSRTQAQTYAMLQRYTAQWIRAIALCRQCKKIVAVERI